MFEWFTLLVAVLAALYAGVARFIQNKLINRQEMQDVQNESKRLSADYEKAKKENDKKKMDQVMKEQLEVLPKMNKVMLGQFKPMIIILVIFFALTYFVGFVDPFVKDDFVVTMHDDGKGCDKVSGDGIFSGCFNINGTNYGKWSILFNGKKSGMEPDSNSSYIIYNVDKPADTFIEAAKGEPLIVSTDKKTYMPGEEVKLYAQSDRNPDDTEVSATLDNGTAFYVDLPLSIPIINVQRIHQPYWWFILISLILNLILSAVMGKMQKPAATVPKVME